MKTVSRAEKAIQTTEVPKSPVAGAGTQTTEVRGLGEATQTTPVHVFREATQTPEHAVFDAATQTLSDVRPVREVPRVQKYEFPAKREVPPIADERYPLSDGMAEL